MSTRIDKYLANNGYCSRRKVEAFLKRHLVIINDKRIKEPGERFDSSKDRLLIDNKKVHAQKLVYFVVNKPLGYVSSVSDDQERKTVLDLLPKTITLKYRLYPVGRLDKDSQGLVILTNDGDLTFKFTHPRFHIPKSYLLTIDGKIKPKYLQLFQEGIRLKEYKTAPAQVATHSFKDNKTTLELTIYEGKNRQIRRMCKALNLELLSLVRVAIGDFKIESLKLGSYQEITKEILTAERTING